MRRKLVPVAALAIIVAVFSHARGEPPAQTAADKPSSGQYVVFSAVGLRILKPDGFGTASNFHGFQQPDSGASVMLSAIPGPFSQINAGFTAERLQTRGVHLQSKEDVTIDGQSGAILRATQSANGVEYAKWIVVFGNDDQTRIVTANFPATNEKLEKSLRSVVLSARLDSTPPKTADTEPEFTLNSSTKLKRAPQGMGKFLVYTSDGTMPTRSPEDPLFIAAPSMSRARIEDKRKFSTERMFKTAHTKVSAIVSHKPIVIDGLDGFEAIADATDEKTETPLLLYQVILFDGGSYIVMQGLVGRQDRDESLSEFKALARSLHRR
jgi:hypothetical protein